MSLTLVGIRRKLAAAMVEQFVLGMKAKFNFVPPSILLFAVFLTGCKPSSSSVNGSPNSSDYFKTPFQTESQFIVEQIVTDLAEQMFYAKNHRLPDAKYFHVIATEKVGSSDDAPVYEFQIRLDSRPEMKSEVTVNAPIWSPEVYQDLADNLANAVGLGSGSSAQTEDTAMLSSLTDGTTEAIEEQSEKLSAELEENFTDTVLHEQAALLLGAFALREHSGNFYDIRFPLSRITAHLLMARYLSGDNSYGLNGQMAKAMLLTLTGNETFALQQLSAITNDTAAPFVRALQARNTGDYRPLDTANGLTPVESMEWFCTMANYVGGPVAWEKLSDVQKQTVDFVRIAYQSGHSVEMGHQLMAVALPLELQEINDVYQNSQHKKLDKNEFVKALNKMPDRCFTMSDGQVHVQVIGWGQWAAFLQRQLCHAVQQDFYMLQYMWGVPDDAKEFAAKCDGTLDGLRLYPFVRRFDCTDEASYHKAVDDGFKVTVATPQLVPAECWNYLCYRVNFAPMYSPNPNPHVNEWFRPNPPPGTVYDLWPRLDHPSLTGRGESFLEKLHAMAPYNILISNFILENKYKRHPDYTQAMDLFSNVLPYSVAAIQTVANTVTGQPARYEELMLQGAKLTPTFYYDLADFYDKQNDKDKAAQYYDQACNADPDSVQASYYAPWRVRYYLKKGQIEKARQIADEGAQVYSSSGLAAEALFFELTSNYDDAFNWYSKNEERYDDSGPLIGFCMRYKIATGDTRFDSELKSRASKTFPKGIEQVSLSDFQGAPDDGVLVKQENDKTQAANKKAM